MTDLAPGYLGQWETPYWVGDESRGTIGPIGFAATTLIDRHEFGIAWHDELPAGGVVISNETAVTLDLEAINDEDLARVGGSSA